MNEQDIKALKLLYEYFETDIFENLDTKMSKRKQEIIKELDKLDYLPINLDELNID